MSEGLAQSPCMAAKVGFEPATLRTQDTELTNEPPCPKIEIRSILLFDILSGSELHLCQMRHLSF